MFDAVQALLGMVSGYLAISPATQPPTAPILGAGTITQAVRPVPMSLSNFLANVAVGRTERAPQSAQFPKVDGNQGTGTATDTTKPPAIGDIKGRDPANQGQENQGGATGAGAGAGDQGQTPQQLLVTNVWDQNDIKEIFRDISQTTGVPIIVDSKIDVQKVAYAPNNVPLETAIQQLCFIGGLIYKKKGDAYLITGGKPEDSLFSEFAQTKRYVVANYPAEFVYALLMEPYKKFTAVSKELNIISITAPPDRMNQILGQLRTLDAPPRQFVVEALVSEIVLNEGDEFGFTWNFKNFGVSSGLLLQYDRASATDIATLKALISNGRATLRANPRITAYEGRESSIEVGNTQIFTISQGGINVAATIQSIDSGTSLKFTGFVDDDGYISLNLSPKVSDAAVRDETTGAPTQTKRSATTNVRVKSGETIAIAGLVQEQTNLKRTRMPILGYIPIIGQLFSQKLSTKQRTEVIILITPRLADDGVGKTESERRAGGGK